MILEAVEVLVFTRAFVVKKFGSGSAPSEGLKTGQLTWSKFKSIQEAWDAAKSRSNF